MPGPVDAQLEEIRELAVAVANADAESAQTRRRYYDAIKDAYLGNIRPSAIIEAAGISRQRLHQIINPH